MYAIRPTVIDEQDLPTINFSGNADDFIAQIRLSEINLSLKINLLVEPSLVQFISILEAIPQKVHVLNISGDLSQAIIEHYNSQDPYWPQEENISQVNILTITSAKNADAKALAKFTKNFFPCLSRINPEDKKYILPLISNEIVTDHFGSHDKFIDFHNKYLIKNSSEEIHIRAYPNFKILEDGADYLAQLVASLPDKVTHLRLDNNLFYSLGVDYIQTVLGNVKPAVKQLSLRFNLFYQKSYNNSFRSEGVIGFSKILKALESKGILSLDLSMNHVYELINTLQENHLKLIHCLSDVGELVLSYEDIEKSKPDKMAIFLKLFPNVLNVKVVDEPQRKNKDNFENRKVALDTILQKRNDYITSKFIPTISQIMFPSMSHDLGKIVAGYCYSSDNTKSTKQPEQSAYDTPNVFTLLALGLGLIASAMTMFSGQTTTNEANVSPLFSGLIGGLL